MTVELACFGVGLTARKPLSVRLMPWDNPLHPPEHVLWTLLKDGRTAEARTGIVPIATGRLELRIYVSDGPAVRIADLIWSQMLIDELELDELAEQKKADFLKHGWVECLEPLTRAGGDQEPSGQI